MTPPVAEVSAAPDTTPLAMPAHVPPPPEPICFRGKQAYLIGIGGCGMSGIARLLASHGASVRGSDIAPSEITAALERDGLSVAFDQSSGQLPEGCDLLVASAAVKPDHPQLIEATRRGLPILSYAEALGQCMLVRTGIAVAGTHGKSTTTAMLGAALADAGMEPSVIVGATSGQLARGSLAEPATPIGHRVGSDTVPHGPLAGRPGFLVAESCEFNRSFHHYRPLIASISSVEADHLDVFGSLDEVVRAFHEFAMLIPPAQEGGRLLIAHDGAHRREVTAGLRCSVQTIGFSPQADWVIEADAPARAVTLSHGRERVAAWTMTLPGTHNAINAATALALGTMAGADPAILARSLAAFTGIDRRMQFLG
ncbi:MAG TPA: Mur ligase domain-containing protein, partial [Phycisphaerales bacterium]|nr:Mur ligase domain-containing protein [Phycisphaerales bacterium]